MRTTLILTRAQSQAAELRQTLGVAGVQVIDFPLLQIGPPPDVAAFDAALRALPQTDLAVPVSPAAVHAVFAALPGPWPAHCSIGVVGAGSLHAVRRALAARPDHLPWPRLIAPQSADHAGEGDSDALWEALQLAFPACSGQPRPWQSLKVQILRGGPGRDSLVRRLEAAGARVRVVEAYSRIAPAWSPSMATGLDAALRSGGWWLFTSSEAVRNLQSLLAHRGDPAALHGQRGLAIHPRIARIVREAGFSRVELTGAQPQAVLSTLHRVAAQP